MCTDVDANLCDVCPGHSRDLVVGGVFTVHASVISRAADETHHNILIELVITCASPSSSPNVQRDPDGGELNNAFPLPTRAAGPEGLRACGPAWPGWSVDGCVRELMQV